MRSRPTVVAALVLVMLVAAQVLLTGGDGRPRAATASGDRVALVIGVEGAIGPATTRHVERALEAAAERGAEVVILQLNTPGGLATSMRDIITAILASPVPVVGYVAPPGAHAASAGTYILYATGIAAMAPGTNIGAATPVQIGGLPGLPSPAEKKPEAEGESEKEGSDKAPGEAAEPSEKDPPASGGAGDAMTAKATNDAIAYIRSLAELNGRNAEWAEAAVREAATLSAAGALEQGVIDLVAADLEELLERIDGREVTVGRARQTLATSGLVVETFEPDFLTRALAVLSNPNVAFILMMIGVYGLIFELANPGSIGPGVVGTICLLLGLYALNQLPLDYAGLALLVLGIALMVAEAFTPTFGVLGAGGLVAFTIGAAILVKSDVPAFQISWTTIAASTATSGALLVFLLGYVWRAHRHAVVTGSESLVGSRAEVLDWHDGQGHVWAQGERWAARGAGPIAPGGAVRVTRQDSLTLVVAADTDAPCANQ